MPRFPRISSQQATVRQVVSLGPALVLVQAASGGAKKAPDTALINQATESFDAVVRALMIFADNCS